jgi:hypothetical protein
VLFDGRPAPMIYAVAGQVTCIVPYEVAGQSSTKVTVVYEGQKSNTVTAPVVVTAPGLFTANSSGALVCVLPALRLLQLLPCSPDLARYACHGIGDHEPCLGFEGPAGLAIMYFNWVRLL